MSQQIIEDLKSQRHYIVLNTHEYGFPDLIVVDGSEIKFFVELKGGKGYRVHPNQEDYHKKLEKMGFKVIVVRR